MKGLSRVAVMMGMIATSAAATEAAVIDRPTDESAIEIYVVNNHLVDVRVFAEDADGRLHNLGRVSRGDLAIIDVPDEVTADEFRIKVYPTSAPSAPGPDNFGVKTDKLDATRDHQIRVWLEADLSLSKVEVDRG